MDIIVIEDDTDIINMVNILIRDLRFSLNKSLEISNFKNYNSRLLETISHPENLKLYIIDISLKGKLSAFNIAKKIRQYDTRNPMLILANDETEHQSIYQNIRSIYHIVKKDKQLSKYLFKDILKILETHEVKRFNYHTIQNDISVRLSAITHIIRDKDERKLIIHTNTRTFKVNMPLSEILKCLDHHFIRSHRCCILNTQRVDNYDWKNKTFYLDNGKPIPYLSKKYRSNFEDI